MLNEWCFTFPVEYVSEMKVNLGRGETEVWEEYQGIDRTALAAHKH